MSKPRVLLVSDSPALDSGFGRVAREIGTGLVRSGRYEVAAIGWFHSPSDRLVPFRIYPTNRSTLELNHLDAYAAITYPSVVDQFKPDVVIWIGDEWMVRKAARLPRQHKFIAYVPIDSAPVLPAWIETFKACDEVVVFGGFANKAITQADPTLKTTIIPHGVDADMFHPLSIEERLEAKKRITDQASFIVGCVARNNIRKNLPRLFKAFKQFANPGTTCPKCGMVTFFDASECFNCGNTEDLIHTPEKTDALLYLHSAPIDSAGHNLYYLIDRFDLKGKVGLPVGMGEAKGVPDCDLNQLYNAMDVFASTTTAEGFGLCMDGDTFIHTSSGAKRLALVAAGDRVLSQDGKYHDVTATTSREVDEVYRVSATHVLDTLVTGEHPYFVSRRCGLKHYRLNPSEPVWVNVKDIRPQDLLFFPKPQYANVLPDHLFITDYVKDLETDGVMVWYKMGYSSLNGSYYGQVAEKYPWGNAQVQRAMKSIRQGGVEHVSATVAKIADTLECDTNLPMPQPVRVPNKISVDNTFLEFCGWYLAEGSSGGGSCLELSLCSDEIDVANKFANWFQDTWGVYASASQPSENKAALHVSSGAVAKFFEALLGHGCINKAIPHFMEQGGTLLGPLIKGIFLGDGHFSKKNQKIILSTTSNHLLLKVRDVLASVGILSSMRSYGHESRGNYPSHYLQISLPHVDRFLDFVGMERWGLKSRSEHFIERLDGFLVPVRSVTKVPGSRKVYDIAVQDCHSFVANGILAHNTILEAMSAGLPVVVTNYSGHVEYVKGAGELINVVEWETDQLTHAERAIVDIRDMVCKLDRFYYEKEQYLERWGPYLRQCGVTDVAIEQLVFGKRLCAEFGALARHRALGLQWNPIVERWVEFLDSLFDPSVFEPQASAGIQLELV